MAEIKDKVVTVEALSALHEHGKNTYVTKTDVIPVVNGGTGATDAATARINLGITHDNIGAAAASHTHAAEDIVSGTLPINMGGTGAATADEALTNLGLTATVTELNYCDGVTSNIQSQLNDKASFGHTHDYLPLNGGTLTGNLNINGLILTEGIDYGDTLPTTVGTVGKLFFKRLNE